MGVTVATVGESYCGMDVIIVSYSRGGDGVGTAAEGDGAGVSHDGSRSRGVDEMQACVDGGGVKYEGADEASLSMGDTCRYCVCGDGDGIGAPGD